MRGLEIASFLATAEPPDLGPGPRAGVRPVGDLERDFESTLPGISPQNRDLVLGAILLWHDHLDAAHEIAQRIETQDGSYLHAIMHRREPDYSNAKYWLRRVGVHPCYRQLAAHITENVAPIQPDLARKLVRGGEWDAFAFVDACEAVSRKPADSMTTLLREIQAAEITTFLRHVSDDRYDRPT